MNTYDTDGKVPVLNVGDYVTRLENAISFRKSFDDCVILYLALHQLEHGTINPNQNVPYRSKLVQLLDEGKLNMGYGADGLHVSIRDKDGIGLRTLSKADVETFE